MIERSLSFSGPASPGHTLAPQRRGPGDPCFQIDGDGAIWRTSLADQRSGDRSHQPRRHPHRGVPGLG